MADIAAVTSIEITARDSTRSAIQSVQGGFNQLRNSAGALAGVFAALGGALSIGAFASAIKGAIDYADQLNDLAKKTGITVETLGGLGYVAEQTGTSLEAIAKGTSKLAGLMAEAAAGGQKAAAVFDSMGVSVKGIDGNLKSLDEVMFEVADRFESYQDGAEKAALANQVFGEKLGSQLIPFLDEGGVKIRELIAEYQRYGGVTSETAARADAFNDTLSKISLMASALWRELASALLPTLQAIASIFVEAREKMGGFGGVAEGVTVAVKGLAVGAIAVVEAFKAVGASIGTALGAIAAYARGDSLSSIWNGLKQGFGEVGESVAKAFDNMGKVVNATTSSVAAATDANITKKVAPAVKALGAVTDDTSKRFKAMSESIMIAYENAINWIKSGEEIEEMQRKINQEIADANTAMATYIGDQYAAIRAYQDQTAAIGKTRAELDAMELARQAEIRDLRLMAGWGQEAIDIYEKWAAAMRERSVVVAQQEQTAELVRMWEQVDAAAADAFTNILQGGKGAFDRLKDALKNGLYALLYQMTVRPFIINIAAQLSGNPAVAGMMGGGAGGAGGTGGWGDLLSNAGSIFGGGSLGTLATSFATSGIGASLGLSSSVSSIAGGLSLGVEAAGAIGTSLTAAGSAFAGFAGMVGAAMPYIGAAIALAAAFGLFDDDPSEVQGQFGIRASGGSVFEDGRSTTSALGNVGFLDEGTMYFSGEGAQVFNQVIAGTLDAIASRLTDEQVVNLATRLQATDFGGIEGELTTEEFLRKYGADILGKVITVALEELDPALAAVFAAFEGTADEMTEFANVLLQVHDLTENLPADLRATLISVLDGTGEMSANVLGLAAAYGVLQEVMNRDPVEDALEAIAQAGESAFETLQRTADSFGELIEAYDGTAEASEEMAAATANYYTQLVQVIAGIRQLGTSIDDMFSGTIEDFTLQTLDDDGKKQYYQSQIEALYGQLGSAVDPAEIARITSQINEYMRAAFGLLTPEEQTGLLSQYAEFARQTNELAQARLLVAEAQAQRQADALMSQLRDVLTAAADDFKKSAEENLAAARAQQVAAAMQQRAANTPIVITSPENVVNG